MGRANTLRGVTMMRRISTIGRHRRKMTGGRVSCGESGVSWILAKDLGSDDPSDKSGSPT